MKKATKIGDREWSYRGGFIEHLGRRAEMRSASWRWACCGAGGVCRSKDDAKTAIDAMLREAQAILESENVICSLAEARVKIACDMGKCPDWHLCRHGIDD